ACSLRIRALRRALCAVDPVLRYAAFVEASVMSGSRSAGAAIFEFVAHRWRHAGKHFATGIRSQPAASEIGFYLLQPRRPDREFRLEKAAGPRGLSRLRPHAVSDRRCAGLR